MTRPIAEIDCVAELNRQYERTESERDSVDDGSFSDENLGRLCEFEQTLDEIQKRAVELWDMQSLGAIQDDLERFGERPRVITETRR